MLPAGAESGVFTLSHCRTLRACHTNGVSVLDRIQQVHEKKKRHENAVSNVAKIVMALPSEERAAVMADIIALIDQTEAAEQDGLPRPAVGTVGVPTIAVAEDKPRLYVDLAFDFIKAHPEGVRTRDVAKAIGQDVSNVDGTLRTLLKRRLVERTNRKWYPAKSAPSQAESKPEKLTIRDMIYKVYSTEKGPLAASGIYKGCQKIKPDINRSSVDGEIMRMKAVRLLSAVGRAPNGGSLYALSNLAPSVLNGGPTAN